MRGQAFSVDLVLALAGLVFLAFLAASLNDQLYAGMAAKDQSLELRTAAFQAASQLLYHEGNPVNWTLLPCANVTTIGLAHRRSALDAQKAAQAANWSANDSACFRGLLGLSRRNYNSSIAGFYTNGTLAFGTAAASPPLKEVAVSERNAWFGTALVRVRLQVWIE